MGPNPESRICDPWAAKTAVRSLSATANGDCIAIQHGRQSPEPPQQQRWDRHIDGASYAWASGTFIDAACATADPGVMSLGMGEC
jgi:hypothetical protein